MKDKIFRILSGQITIIFFYRRYLFVLTDYTGGFTVYTQTTYYPYKINFNTSEVFGIFVKEVVCIYKKIYG